MFNHFQPKDTFLWFEERGVKLKVEKDNRVFPVSNNSQTIVDLLRKESQKKGVQLKQAANVCSVEKGENGLWEVDLGDEKYSTENIFISTGASLKVFEMLSKVGLKVVSPVPSLFTFKVEDDRIKDLQGIAFEEVEVKIAGTKLKETGPMLITHWGLSGPSILKTSSRGARELFDKEYQTQVLINFLPSENFESVKQKIQDFSLLNPKKKIGGSSPFVIPKRFWLRITELLEIDSKPWAEIGKKSINKIAETLTAASFKMNGKTTFKEEFVTAGGVELSEVNSSTMEANRFKGLYFGGEVLNIDALTGGFNFQAAWTGAWIASQQINASSI